MHFGLLSFVNLSVSSQKSAVKLVELVETNGLRQAQASFPRKFEKMHLNLNNRIV